jgi:hypothetical protein
MKPTGLMIAGVLLGAGLAAATGTRAQSTPLPQAAPINMSTGNLATGDFMTSPSTAAPPAVGRTLEWDPQKGRWGLKFGVDERVDRATDFRDLAPGVFYRLSPRLHIGGDVTLAPDTSLSPNQHFATPQAPNPRVRLETTFKF